MHEIGNSSPNTLKRVGKTLKRGLGKAALPAAVALALMPAAASAARAPKPEKSSKPQPASVVGRVTLGRILHRQPEPVTSCPGEATIPINVAPGGTPYAPQASGGEASSNTLPVSQAIATPFIVSRTHPNQVVPASADFENGNYDVVGLERSTPLRARAYLISSTTSFNVDPEACAPTVFQRDAAGNIEPNQAINVAFDGGFGSPDLGPVAEMSLVPQI